VNVSDRLADIASLVLEAGQPVLFKRLIHASVVLAKHDTDEELREGIEDDSEENEELYVDDVDEDEPEDDDVEGFAGFPMSALGQRDRRRGPMEHEVSVGRPDWWNKEFDPPDEVLIIDAPGIT
jgi:hypothetical protein